MSQRHSFEKKKEEKRTTKGKLIVHICGDEIGTEKDSGYCENQKSM